MLEQLLKLLQSNYSLYVTFTGLEFWNVALVVFLIILTCLNYVLVRLKKKIIQQIEKKRIKKRLIAWIITKLT